MLPAALLLPATCPNVGARPGKIAESGPGQDCGKWGSSSTIRTSTQLGERRAVMQVKEQKKWSSWADFEGSGGWQP